MYDNINLYLDINSKLKFIKLYTVILVFIIKNIKNQNHIKRWYIKKNYKTTNF